jgi:transposase
VNRPTREELLAIYRAGPEATLALVEALLERIARLEEANDTLTRRVKALEGHVALDSQNSSKPPSSDLGRPKPAPRSLRPRPGETGRAPGGQPGHTGTTLRLVDTPDRLVVHRPAHCGACGQSLDGALDGPPAGAPAAAGRLAPERRQVIELPRWRGR